MEEITEGVSIEEIGDAGSDSGSWFLLASLISLELGAFVVVSMLDPPPKSEFARKIGFGFSASSM